MTIYTTNIGTTVTIGTKTTPELVKSNNRAYHRAKQVVVRRIHKGNVYHIHTPKMAFGPAVDFVFGMALDDPVYVAWDNYAGTCYLTIDTEQDATYLRIRGVN